MRSRLLIALILFLLVPVCSGYAGESGFQSTFQSVRTDFRNFYWDGGNLLLLGIGVGGSALFANTSLDRDIRDEYRKHVKGDESDEIARIMKQPGEGLYTIPFVAVSSVLFNNTVFGDWAQRSTRALAVGAPTLLFLQRAIGSESPQTGGSGWKPFQSKNAVSGHGFVGGVPFITAAQMSDNVFLKGALYAVSALPALSRVNDDAHYFSQAAFGWYLGYLSSRAVMKTEKGKKDSYAVWIAPLPGNGAGVFISGSF